MQTVASPVPPRQPGILGDYLRGLMPDDLIHTVSGFVSDHRTFFDEVFRGDWRRKTRPVPFFVTCFAAVLFLGQFAPGMQPGWAACFDALSEEQQGEFVAALGFDRAASIDWENPFTVEAQMEDHLRGELGITGTVTADHAIGALRERGHTLLALQLENHFLQLQRDEGQFQTIGLHFLVLFYLVPVWWLLHRFLGVPHRSAKDTVYVNLYTSGVGLAFIGLPALFLNTGNETVDAWLGLWVLGASGYLWVKTLRVWRYTHGVGFWALTKAGFKTNLVVMGAVFGLAMGALVLGWMAGA